MAEDVSDAALAALLDANDALNAALRLWRDSRNRAPSGGCAAPLAHPGSDAAALPAADWRTLPGQLATSAAGSFRAEQHTQWYSPLGSSLPGGPSPLSAGSGGSLDAAPPGAAAAAPRPSSGAATALPAGDGASPEAGLPQRSGGSLGSALLGSAAGATEARAAGPVAKPSSAAAASDWLVRGETPLINLLSWHEPGGDAPALAPEAQTRVAAAETRAACLGAPRQGCSHASCHWSSVRHASLERFAERVDPW